MMSRVLVIGGGVIGLSTAYYAMRKGHEVRVVDRAAAQRDGCSFGNAGMVVPSHFIPLAAPGMVALGLKWMWNPRSPFYIKPRLNWDLLAWGWRFWRAATPEHVRRAGPLLRDMSMLSRSSFEELSALPGHEFGLVKKGLMMLCKTGHALEEEAKAAEQARALGIPAEVLDAKGAAALEPGVTMEIEGAVFFPKDCHLSPARFMAGLQRQLEAGGAAFNWGAEVRGWKLEGNRVRAVVTSQGELEADEFVVCGGVWSPEVSQGLGLNLPMQAGKGYSMTVPKPRQMPSICSILTEARVAVTPMDGGLRFGGTMEMAGVNETINPKRVEGIIRAVPRYYPAFAAKDFEGVPVWRGLRPCSPDGLPYVGRVGRYANLSVAAGHAMLGLSLGPATGRIMAQILSGEKPQIEVGLLDPERFR